MGCIKRLVRPGLPARRTLAGFVAYAMIRKVNVRNIDGRDVRTQAIFIAGIFYSAA